VTRQSVHGQTVVPHLDRNEPGARSRDRAVRRGCARVLDHARTARAEPRGRCREQHAIPASRDDDRLRGHPDSARCGQPLRDGVPQQGIAASIRCFEHARGITQLGPRGAQESLPQREWHERRVGASRTKVPHDGAATFAGSGRHRQDRGNRASVDSRGDERCGIVRDARAGPHARHQETLRHELVVRGDDRDPRNAQLVGKLADGRQPGARRQLATTDCRA
jgi:hypothetical protein